MAFALLVYAAYHSLLGPGCMIWRHEGQCMGLYIGASDAGSVEEAVALLDPDVSAIIAEGTTFHKKRVFVLLGSIWLPVAWYLDAVAMRKNKEVSNDG